MAAGMIWRCDARAGSARCLSMGNGTIFERPAIQRNSNWAPFIWAAPGLLTVALFCRQRCGLLHCDRALSVVCAIWCSAISPWTLPHLPDNRIQVFKRTCSFCIFYIGICVRYRIVSGVKNRSGETIVSRANQSMRKHGHHTMPKCWHLQRGLESSDLWLFGHIIHRTDMRSWIVHVGIQR